jgi:hypothetical protein
LLEATNIPLKDIDSCWEVLKDDVWQFLSVEEVTQEDEKAFINYGWAHGFCVYFYLFYRQRVPFTPMQARPYFTHLTLTVQNTALKMGLIPL